MAICGCLRGDGFALLVTPVPVPVACFLRPWPDDGSMAKFELRILLAPSAIDATHKSQTGKRFLLICLRIIFVGLSLTAKSGVRRRAEEIQIGRRCVSYGKYSNDTKGDQQSYQIASTAASDTSNSQAN